jgi:mono/diheme cytochrome c family protein
LLFGLASVVPSYLAGRSLAIPPSADEVFGGLLFALLMVALVAGISAPSRVRSRRSAHPVPRTWLPNNSLKLTRLIAYLKSVPPVDNQFPERRIELLGRLLMAVGLFPVPAVDKIDHTSPPGELPMAGVSIASGRYLTRTCLECHGASLNGAPFGPPGQEVPTPNLTPGGVLAGWTKEQFFTTIRTGINPGGHRLSDDMPWGNFGQMTDEELGSVWLYLQSLAALPQGG